MGECSRHQRILPSQFRRRSRPLVQAEGFPDGRSGANQLLLAERVSEEQKWSAIYVFYDLGTFESSAHFATSSLYASASTARWHSNLNIRSSTPTWHLISVQVLSLHSSTAVLSLKTIGHLAFAATIDTFATP